MYRQVEGGRIVDIQGLPCCVPPESYVYNILTKSLEKREIYKRSDNPKEQYWERIPTPYWYSSVMRRWDDYEKKAGDDAAPFYDEKLEKYKEQEWDRRLNGFWFMNYNPKIGRSEATYITGLHYLYLQWWPIDVGYPKFRIPDMEKFYFLQYCIEDPDSMGMVEVTKRRFGKSFMAGIFVADYVTRTKMTNGGIQSKTGTDAKKFFSKTIVTPFRSLPRFFRPEYDTSLGPNPKSEMRFQKTNTRGKKGDDGIGKDELGSLIDWQSAETVSYDGQKLHRYVADEVGKTSAVNVYDRHEVIRYCLLDDESRIIGKALYTTTVEKLEIDSNGIQDAFKLLWDKSNQLFKGADGRTESGLYRFFMSAKKTRHIDIYGYADEDRALKSILADRETVKNNPRALSARIKKEPLTIEEAFSADADSCAFNAVAIENRINQLKEKPAYKRNIVFYRKEDGNVAWRDSTDREKDFCWQITQFPPDGEENKFEIRDRMKRPSRIQDGAITVDSYSNSQGGRRYGSKACAWIGRRADILRPDDTNKPIGCLYGRPDIKDKLHEQVMLAGEYYGYPVFYEHTADDYEGYFRERGKIGYLGLYPLTLISPEKRDNAERYRGTPITPFSLTRQMDLGVIYFNEHCDRIDWIELLENALIFDPYDRTKYDMMVSFLILLSVLSDSGYSSQKKKYPLVKVY